jgi:hypothetical protein
MRLHRVCTLIQKVEKSDSEIGSHKEIRNARNS